MHRVRAFGLAVLGIAFSPALVFAQDNRAVARPSAAPTAAAGKPKTKPASKHPALPHAAAAVATLPGFEVLPDGGSRLFVELTSAVAVEQKKAAGTLTYVLKGAHIVHRNNQNALVTVHFNTPVTRARLLPAGHDLHFVVDLRQNAVPTWKLAPATDGSAILQIDFPKGDYLRPDADNPTPTAPDAEPSPPAAPSAPAP